MNRYFEEDILSLSQHLLAKIQAAPGLFPAASEEPGAGQLKAIEQAVRGARMVPGCFQYYTCQRRGDLRLPEDPEMVDFILENALEDLDKLLAPETVNLWLPLLREDLEKLRTLLQQARDALAEAQAQWAALPAQPAQEPDLTDIPYPGADACREIFAPSSSAMRSESIPEEQMQPIRQQQILEEQRRYQEHMLMELERLKRSNASMVPPSPPVAHPSAPKPAPNDQKSQKKGLFASLLERKKSRKKVPEADDVQFRAAAPAQLHPGAYFPVRVMMYLDGDDARADRAQSELDEKVKSTTSGIFKARQDQLFRITLRSPDVAEMNETAQLCWNGRFASVDMELLLPEDFDKKQLRLHGRVYADDAVLTDLKVILQVAASGEQELIWGKCTFRSAFISYASADVNEVLRRIQGIQLAAPELDLFMDLKDLNRGEHWEPRLFHEIQKRDLFYLFWSKNAAASPWVAKELTYAIENKGLDRIEPVPLEPPDECPPPAALQDRHFNDWTLRYRKT